MKKVFFVVLASSMLLCGCSDKDGKTSNYLGGTGEIFHTEGAASKGVVYDDENIYFNYTEVYRLDKDGELMINCDIATCKHDNEECKAASREGEYFVFGGKLYQCYRETDLDEEEIVGYGYIKDCDTGKVVFDNPVPEDLEESKKLDSSTEIYSISVINDDYMKVEGHRHAYILDKDFNIVCWYGDVGKFQWGYLYEDKYYYINDLYQLAYIDVKSGEKGVLEWENKVLFAGADKDNLFYADEYNDFYRYSLKDDSSTKIGENIWFFSVYDGYIYCDQIIDEQKEKIILDYEGNIKYTYTANKYMGSDNLVKVGDKLYNMFLEEGKKGVAMMNIDGTGYKEVYIQ